VLRFVILKKKAWQQFKNMQKRMQMEISTKCRFKKRERGEEFSVFAVCDGNKAIPIELSCQDHKERDAGGTGPMTGGMGSYCPAPVADRETVRIVADEIMTPVVQYLRDELKTPYIGFLYAGMIHTKEGHKVLEFNCRFGDPEIGPAMMMMENSLVDVIEKAMDGNLRSEDFTFRRGAACCIVLASPGYPINPETGDVISGIEEAAALDNVMILRGGTGVNEAGEIVTAGGRVVEVNAYSPEGIKGAQALAYKAANLITIPRKGWTMRTDIADQALNR